MSAAAETVLERMRRTIAERDLATPETPVLLMVSGGSDSTALAYLAHELRERGGIGEVAVLHVNHCLRGAASDGDAAFVAQLADALEFPLFACKIDIAGEARRTKENVEAVARRERYRAAAEALASLARHAALPVADARIFTAHTADDRAENFYMRSIVGTGPGGFRSMLYRNGQVARPLLEASREELRAYLHARAEAGCIVVRDEAGALWREDATNAHTDRFRAYVRHEIVPRAQERNPQLLATLTRTMNLIADEDDLLEEMAARLEAEHARWEHVPVRADAGFEGGAGSRAFASDVSPEVPSREAPPSATVCDAGKPLPCEACMLAPELGEKPLPLQRRVCTRVLKRLLGTDARIETASVEAVLAAYRNGAPISGYTANIQGNLAVSANKRGVRVEPMAAYRARRKPGQARRA